MKYSRQSAASRSFRSAISFVTSSLPDMKRCSSNRGWWRMRGVSSGIALLPPPFSVLPPLNAEEGTSTVIARRRRTRSDRIESFSLPILPPPPPPPPALSSAKSIPNISLFLPLSNSAALSTITEKSMSISSCFVPLCRGLCWMYWRMYCLAVSNCPTVAHLSATFFGDACDCLYSSSALSILPSWKSRSAVRSNSWKKSKSLPSVRARAFARCTSVSATIPNVTSGFSITCTATTSVGSTITALASPHFSSLSSHCPATTFTTFISAFLSPISNDCSTPSRSPLRTYMPPSGLASLTSHLSSSPAPPPPNSRSAARGVLYARVASNRECTCR
mmetsp:Transcript_45811/g.118398  ORF Transcript_45811/g.118398 Transcript_45811/m.118398 type:complete len:333 (-) Transcript_45811:981-1979(-)